MIEVEGLGKRFGAQVALDGVALSVQAGEMVAVVGPDGAGKTTLLRLLTGLLRRDKGSVRIGGLDPETSPAEVRGRIGFSGDAAGLYGRLDALENLRFSGRLFGLEEEAIERRSQELLAWLGLQEQRRTPASRLSDTLRQRLALARALLHDPPVLLLDEPTRTLEPDAAASLHACLDQLREQGKTLLVCTRDIDEAARLGSRVAFLHTSILACDTVEAIRRGPGPRRIAIGVSRLGGEELQLLQSLRFVKGFELAPGLLRAAVADRDRDVPELVRRLGEIGCQVHEVRDDDPSLAEVYRQAVAAP